jgi:SAM-dependent methyltransferase
VTPEQFQSALPREVSFATAFGGFTDFCRELIADGGHRRVCEIGGGRRPLLAQSDAAELGIDYAILDISASELDLAEWPDERIVANVAAPNATIPPFDFVFSRMLAEHVPDGRQMHQNLFDCVTPGGRALHFFPTLYSPAFVANRILPTGLSGQLQKRFAPRSHPKFPALYSMCVGPRQRQLCALGVPRLLWRQLPRPHSPAA